MEIQKRPKPANGSHCRSNRRLLERFGSRYWKNWKVILECSLTSFALNTCKGPFNWQSAKSNFGSIKCFSWLICNVQIALFFALRKEQMMMMKLQEKFQIKKTHSPHEDSLSWTTASLSRNVHGIHTLEHFTFAHSNKIGKIWQWWKWCSKYLNTPP